MKNNCVGFKISPRPCRGQARAERVIKDKLRTFGAEIRYQRGALPCCLALVLILAGAGASRAQSSGAYRVDTQASQIEIHLYKGGFLGAFGDNHLISLTQFSGTADLSQADGWKAELKGKATSLKVIDPWGNPSERKDVQDTMLGPEQLDVSHFPVIELHSVEFNPTQQDGTWRLVADVRLHGVTRKVQFSLDCHQIGDKLQIQGKKMFKLTDFDIQPYSAALGTVKVKNEFQVTYNIVLVRAH